MVYRFAVGLFMAACVSAVWIPVTLAQTDCSTIVREGDPHTIEDCQPVNCSVNVSRENVIWCLDYCSRRGPECLLNSLCRNSTGYTSTADEVPVIINRIQLTDSGGLDIPEVAFELRNSTYNCSVVDGEGNICGTQSIKLTFRLFTAPDIRIESPRLVRSDADTATVGERMAMCVQGKSPIRRNTHWEKGVLQIPTTDISTDCLQCSCLGDVLDGGFNLSLGSSPNETRYSAFLVSAVDDPNCSGIFGFMSFLVIDNVTFGDEGSYTFYLLSGIFGKDETFTIAEPEYFFLEPDFHNPGQDVIALAESDDEFLLCNATTSGAADLQWKWNGSVIPTQVINGTSPSNFSDMAVTDICRQLSPTAEGGVFSIALGRTQVRHYTSNNVATVALQQVGLFLCAVRVNNTGSYYCVASDSVRQSPHVQIKVNQSSSLPEELGLVDPYIAIGVVAAVAVALLAVLILACSYWKYRSLKTEALPMSPMESFPLHSFANPALLHLVASRQDPLEFPRESLTFIRVLGEGQFGQVWEAIATGICPDHTRNIVAVKTLKLNSRPSDRDDLESEVEIMRHMEPHPNIINFLGQCSTTATDPLCILMEYAVFGSLKSYLSECKRAMNTHPAPMPVSPYPYPLCPYHYHKMLQNENEGDYPDMQAAGNTAPAYAVDPAVVAHMQRLLRLLQSDDHPYCSDYHPNCSDYYPYQQGNDSSGAISHYDKLAVSNYDKLAPLTDGSQCAYHPQLEAACHHPPAPEFASGRSEYYNQADTRESAAPRQQSASFQDHFLRSGNEATPAPAAQFSPSYTNVQDSTSGAAADHPPADEYDYTPPATCSYCNQLASLVEYSNVGGGPIAPPPDGAAARQSMFSLANLYEGGLTHFDVLDFAVQIARGMEHLEKMKCVHRDLAARNVLIAEGFLLKIGDFGLARDLTERDYYRKITAGRLPVRWMAIESLQDRTHTHKSDVWSYGVVLWEILTYGDLPYGKTPIASSLEALTNHLRTGNRLSQPTGCSDEMYGLMRSCWDADSTKRPSFSELVSTFDNLLSVAHGYLTMSAEATIQHRRSSMMEATLPARWSSMVEASLPANGGNTVRGGGGTEFLSPLTAALHSVSTTCLARSPSDRNLARHSIVGMTRSPSASCIPTLGGTSNALLPSNTANRDPPTHATPNRTSQSASSVPAAGRDSGSAPHEEAVPTQPPLLLCELPELMVTPAATETPPATMATQPATTVTPVTMVTPPATTATPVTVVTPPATAVTPVTVITPPATTVTPVTKVTPPATTATPVTVVTPATAVTPVTVVTPPATTMTPVTKVTPATTATPVTVVTPPATTATPVTKVTPATTATPVTVVNPATTVTPAVMENGRITPPQSVQSRLFQAPDLIPNGHLPHTDGKGDTLPKDIDQDSVLRPHSRSLQKREGCQETAL